MLSVVYCTRTELVMGSNQKSTRTNRTSTMIVKPLRSELEPNLKIIYTLWRRSPEPNRPLQLKMFRTQTEPVSFKTPTEPEPKILSSFPSLLIKWTKV